MNVIFSDSTRHPDALSIRLIEYSMNLTTGIASEENNAMQELVAVIGNNKSAKINMMTT